MELLLFHALGYPARVIPTYDVEADKTANDKTSVRVLICNLFPPCLCLSKDPQKLPSSQIREHRLHIVQFFGDLLLTY